MTDLIKKIVCESDLFYPIFVQNGAAKRGDIGYGLSTVMTRGAELHTMRLPNWGTERAREAGLHRMR